jgi:hypothetical protein
MSLKIIVWQDKQAISQSKLPKIEVSTSSSPKMNEGDPKEVWHVVVIHHSFTMTNSKA